MLNWKGLNSQGAPAAGGATLLEEGELRSDGGATSVQPGGFELRFILSFTREQVWIELTLTLTLILTLTLTLTRTLTLAPTLTLSLSLS